MCMSACSSSTAPTSSAATTTSGGAFTPAIGGDAETGVSAITQDTGFDTAADPTDQAAAGLAAQLQQAQAMLRIDPATSTSGGGAAGSFAAAVEQREAIQLVPMNDGASAIANLDTILAARERRVARLEEAYLNDPAADPAGEQVVESELRMLEETRQLRDKLATLASTIDPTEAKSILTVVGSASQRGGYQPEELAELLIQVEGSAHGMPTSYIQSAIAVQEQLKQSRAEMEQVAQQIASDPKLASDPSAMQLLLQMSDFQLESQEVLRENFELAKQDPATAQAQLQAFAAAA